MRYNANCLLIQMEIMIRLKGGLQINETTHIFYYIFLIDIKLVKNINVHSVALSFSIFVIVAIKATKCFSLSLA